MNEQNWKKWSNQIEDDLKLCLAQYGPNHNFSKVLEYSVLPAGKFFRPYLVYTLASDLGIVTDDHKALASSIELHHTYTLIHDDLPSMDDDDYRRGRKSAHVMFSEWEAILSGDSLLCLSFEAISKISSAKLSTLLKIYTESVGPRGLILGQVMDLGNENKSLESLLKLHELKTARLIQLSLTGANLLCERPINHEDLNSVGYYLGVNFQLLDDLCELTEPINTHEMEINPFLHFDKSRLIETIKNNNLKMRLLLKKYELKNVESYINLYLSKVENKLQIGLTAVNKHVALTKEEVKELCL